jgi:hypothetical protein
MSDAALAIWISSGSLLVSAGSLVISLVTYRRSDTLRRVDRPNELSRDIADRRPRVDPLERTNPAQVPKRDAGVEKPKLVTAQQASARLERLVQYMRDRAERPK